jgi:hypothetical protein
MRESSEVYRLEQGAWLVVETYGGDETLRVEPFAAVDVDVRRWWTGPSPP